MSSHEESVEQLSSANERVATMFAQKDTVDSLAPVHGDKLFYASHGCGQHICFT